MRPFFSYYGSKWNGAKHYGPPRRDLVIEPFAGSAMYSTRWDCPRVKLFDVSRDICDLWDWLIGCSSADIEAIPATIHDLREIEHLPRGAQMLVRFWVAKGRAEPARKLSSWYEHWRGASACRVWGEAVKRRIIAQKPGIDGWEIACRSWDEIEVEEAHWHVDPPYSGPAGRKYPHSDVSYPALASWCMTLPGSVDVCENVGATWLPFEPLYEVVTSRGRRSGARSKEAIWRKDGTVDGL